MSDRKFWTVTLSAFIALVATFTLGLAALDRKIDQTECDQFEREANVITRYEGGLFIRGCYVELPNGTAVKIGQYRGEN